MSGAPTRMIAVGAALVGVLVVVAVLAPLLAPYDPHAPVGAPLESPSATHWLGTNDVGQDVLSQVVWGARAALAVAVGAAALSVAIGGLAGTAAGLVGGMVDVALMRLTDVVLALPGLPLLLVVVTFTGPSRGVLVLIIAGFSWPWSARIVRSHVLSLRTRGFVHAVAGFGARPWYVIRRHLVPAVAPLAAAAFVEVASVAVVLDAGLAFLGLADPGTASWGLMLNRAIAYPGWYFSSVWTWWVVPPGVAVTLAVIGLTFVGMGVAARHQGHTAVPATEPTS